MTTVEDIRASKSTDVLKTVLGSVLFVFKLCGIYIEENEGKWFKVRRLLFAIYSTFVFVLIWTDNVRLFVIISFEDDIRRQLSFLVFILMYIILSFYFTIFLRLISRKLPAILKAFRSYHEEYDMKFDWRRWRRNVRILSVLSALIYALDVVGAAAMYNLSFVSKKSILNMQAYPANLLSNQFLSSLVFFLIILRLIYAIAFHNYLIIFFCIICRVITREYVHVRDKITAFVKRLSNDELCDPSEINCLRKHHTAITELMSTSNDVMKHIAAIQYSITIPVVCLILYGLSHGKLVVEDITILSFNIIIHFLVMLLITHFGSKLNKEAHSSFHILYTVELEKLNHVAISEIQIYLMRLKGPPIGIDIYGLFTIDGTTVPMLMGTLVTYTVVVLQMAPYQETNSTVSCIFNSTTT